MTVEPTDKVAVPTFIKYSIVEKYKRQRTEELEVKIEETYRKIKAEMSVHWSQIIEECIISDPVITEYTISDTLIWFLAAESILKEDGDRWIKKVKSAYEILCKADLNPGDELLICAIHFAGKPDENLEPLVDRLKQILCFRKDYVSSALLAASYYGLEELKMRLPRVEMTLTNPFEEGENLEAISGTIMIADGGPAEGAKAIGMYMYLKQQGIHTEDKRVIRMISLLAILSSNPVKMAMELDCKNEEAFLLSAMRKIWGIDRSEEALEKMNPTAANLLMGMMQEVDTILCACTLDQLCLC